ncbi:hypothetical protein MML48_5g00005486 [Holotrichia oblita]|uniref:Uncharacterized protein n=1 Tax=Holotrichia oblita TaxID=644536 RepID=A0ACB9T4X2_HOLOL|nr:hypothetical protein MML48_5g00005486 [Holotrichia oblita]
MSINNLEKVIEPYLKGSEKQFISYETKNLLPAGENYGSTMLSLDINVQNKNGQQETIHCVAKTLPPKKMQEFFNTKVTFKKEVAFYTTKCIGARISSDPNSQDVDEDAVIILENLKHQGFSVGNRFVGFNLETTKLILKDMAKMHGTFIAFKLAKPVEFQEKIGCYLDKALDFVAPDDMLDNLVKHVQRHASRNLNCIPLLSKIDENTRKMKGYFVYSKYREPFGTIVHNDLWTNNMLIKYLNDEPIDVIFVDFQVLRYGSPARDVLFFLYSSVQLDVLKTELDELIEFYHSELVNTIKLLKCDISLFSYEAYLEEMKIAAEDTEFCHQMFMLTPLYTIEGGAIDLSEWEPTNIAPENEEILDARYYDRLHFIILDFAKRKWI